MKKLLSLLIVVVLCVVVVRKVMAIPMPSQVNRAVWILSLLKNADADMDGQLDLMPLAEANDWVERVYNAYGSRLSPVPVDDEGNPKPYSQWSADQKGRYYCNSLRQHHINLVVGKIRQDANTDAEEAAAIADAESELGTEEPLD